MNRYFVSCFALLGMFGAVACTVEEGDGDTSTTTTNPTGTSSGGAGGTGGSTSNTGGSTSNTGGSGGSATTVEAVCEGIAAPGMGDGSCVQVGMALQDCNPVTGVSEDGVCGDGPTDLGTACDAEDVDDYTCFPPGSVACGAACDSADNPCEAGFTCTDKGAFAGTDLGANPVCARWCCTDTDCGDGVCVSVEHGNASLGVCLSAQP